MRSSLQRTRPRPTQVFHPVPHLFARLASPGRLFLVHIKIDPSPWSMLPAGLFPRFRLFLRETDFIRLAALRVFALQPYRDRSVSQKLIGTGGNQTGVPGTYSYIYGILPYSTVHCLTLHYMTWQSPPHQSLPIPPCSPVGHLSFPTRSAVAQPYKPSAPPAAASTHTVAGSLCLLAAVSHPRRAELSRGKGEGQQQ